MKLIALMIAPVMSILASLPAEAGSRIEAWKNGKEIVFVERDAQGRFERSGELKLENWRGTDDRSEWVARYPDGTLVTGYKGYLEKFKLDGKRRESLRLVIRNADGQLVTWLAVDDLISAGFERIELDRGNARDNCRKETVYVIRYNGKLLNWAKAKLESWANFEHPVLVVRDTEDSINNGKLLAWIAPEETRDGRVIYRDPETGEFVSANR